MVKLQNDNRLASGVLYVYLYRVAGSCVPGRLLRQHRPGPLRHGRGLRRDVNSYYQKYMCVLNIEEGSIQKRRQRSSPLIKFLAALDILHQDDLKKRIINVIYDLFSI